MWMIMAHAEAQEGYTALIAAAHQGHTDCLRILMDGGAHKEADDKVRVDTTFPLRFGCNDKLQIERVSECLSVCLYVCV